MIPNKICLKSDSFMKEDSIFFLLQFNFQALLRDHNKTHLPFNCVSCNNAFDSKATFRNHLTRFKSCKAYWKNHHKSKEDSTLATNSQFICLTCNKSFRRRDNYNRHMKFRCESGNLQKSTIY